MHSAGKMRIGVNTFYGRVLETLPKKCSREHSIRKYSWAHPDGVADLLRVEVVVDEAVDDGGQLALHQGVALLLQGGAQKAAQGVAQLLEELHDLVLGGVAGDEVVEVGDDVDADGAGELVPALGHGHGGGHEGGEEEEGCLHLVVVVFGSFLREVIPM